jgi:type IX secretion system PorP/SprF family membrane protein
VKRLLTLLCLFITVCSYAQQSATFAQYAFNGLAINPGYAGSHDLLSVSAISRFQNAGLDGAPNTQTFAIHSPLPLKNLAVGAMFIKDGLGVINQTGVHGIAAYRIFFDGGGERYLSFGMQMGSITYSARYSDLEILNPADPAFAEDIRQSRFNVGAGLFYRTEQLYLGVSMPHMINNALDRTGKYGSIRQSVPLLIHGGYVFFLSPMIKYKPNFLFKVMDGRPVELDLNSSFLLDDLLWVGFSYKLPSGLNLLTEFQVTDQLLLGYSYAMTRGALRNVDLGTHEILLNYRFKFFKYGIVSPRYF